MEVNREGFVSFFNNLVVFFSSLFDESGRLFPDGRLPARPVIMVHSALSAFGHVPLGAATVLEALRRAARDRDMTVVMPAHSDVPARPEPSSTGDTDPPPPVEFEPRTTPCAGMGAIAELFRTGSRVRRSAHPLLSFCAEGPRARRLLSGHRPGTGLGPRSPAGRIAEAPALVLLLGVGYETATLLHLGEYARAGAEDAGRVTCRAVTRWGFPPFRRARCRSWEDIVFDAESFAETGDAFERTAPDRILRGPIPGGTGEFRLFLARDLVRFSIDRSSGNGVL